MLSSFDDSPLKVGDEVFIYEYETLGRVIQLISNGIYYVVEVTAIDETVVGPKNAFMTITPLQRRSFVSKVGSA